MQAILQVQQAGRPAGRARPVPSPPPSPLACGSGVEQEYRKLAQYPAELAAQTPEQAALPPATAR